MFARLAQSGAVRPNAARLFPSLGGRGMSDGKKPRLVGINHVAIEVGDIDEALEWYGRIFEFTLRGKGEQNAFIDMGDQFINLTRLPDHRAEGVEKRHIGFVVDDRSRIIELAKEAGA